MLFVCIFSLFAALLVQICAGGFECQLCGSLLTLDIVKEETINFFGLP